MDTERIMLYEKRKVNPGLTWLLFIFLGWSYGSMGKIGLQILFYITLGGCGVWYLIRLFTLNGAIKKHNQKIAAQLGLSDADKIHVGLL